MNPQDELELVKWLDNMLTNILSHHAKYFHSYYENEQTFRRRLGISTNKFYEWKKLGKFEKAMHPATRGSKRVLYHKYFNVHANLIQLPEMRRLPIEPKHRRNSHGKKAANPQGSPVKESRQGFQKGSSENATQGNQGEATQSLPEEANEQQHIGSGQARCACNAAKRDMRRPAQPAPPSHNA